MNEKMKFACGHEGVIPLNIGRGMARQRRLADYCAYRCPECQRKHYEEYAANLTWADGSPMGADAQARWVARRMTKMPYVAPAGVGR